MLYHKKNRSKGYDCSTIKILINICFTLGGPYSSIHSSYLKCHNFEFGFHRKNKKITKKSAKEEK